MAVGCHQWVAGSTGQNREGVLWQEREAVCVSEEREQWRRLSVQRRRPPSSCVNFRRRKLGKN